MKVKPFNLSTDLSIKRFGTSTSLKPDGTVGWDRTQLFGYPAKRPVEVGGGGGDESRFHVKEHQALVQRRPGANGTPTSLENPGAGIPYK